MPKRKAVVAVKEPDFQQVANEYAHNSIESMRDDLDALEHAKECSGQTDCKACDGRGVIDGIDPEPDKECEACDGTGQVKCKRGSETKPFTLANGTTGNQMIHNCEEAWHDEDTAQQQIDEGPLSVEVRSGWYNPGSMDASAEEYNILLGTGGPAARIRGELDGRGQPTSAKFEYQDWFKPWTVADTTNEEDETMLEYVQNFYFGD